ncbi:uncharacterized protein LOC128278593 [Anopheles cruzii]|uniref:uncharacterized protein LOC128278593 n=1 Tax=Anopheles cruzii TaxID=68878 RepID=UPI0022EC32A9|nr:uncharacterized protein LOC128278593 [Anopheles cruzii]XP_052873293.1 uncharacterized protein LOC128278593 [Anopheles cruzii]XP_052873300.1 uncharacterized protein LOC128278593 [Anopheles cruzii]
MQLYRSWSSATALTALVVLVCATTLALAAPNVRVKRGEAGDTAVITGAETLANPLTSEASKQSAQAVKDAIHPTRPPIPVTTDDTPDLDRQKVSLQVPDELFGSSFTLVTNISGRIGNLIMGTARRAGEFFWVLQPLFGKHLTIEIPSTTTTTTTQRTTTTTTTTTARRQTVTEGKGGEQALVLDLLSGATDANEV